MSGGETSQANEMLATKSGRAEGDKLAGEDELRISCSPDQTASGERRESGELQADRQVEGEQQRQQEEAQVSKPIELRLLVRRREAGALIGKRGSNIKRLRETYRDSASLSVADTGNGPERVLCIVARSWRRSLEPILRELSQLMLQKSAASEAADQIELKMLVHSLHAGSIIGLGGQTIKRLRTVSRGWQLSLFLPHSAGHSLWRSSHFRARLLTNLRAANSVCLSCAHLPRAPIPPPAHAPSKGIQGGDQDIRNVLPLLERARLCAQVAAAHCGGRHQDGARHSRTKSHWQTPPEQALRRAQL